MPIKNPILPGFFPDPSICRAGDDYYIVNSTFEWFPGVPVHHSKDLRNWRLIGHLVTRRSQLDLRGVPDSGGVWAPSLSYADGRFWLIYTNVRMGFGRPFKDIKIHLITAEHILGPWSDPIELNSLGFDPSLFHDADGRKWLVNMIWDFRHDRSSFGGLILQEYDVGKCQLVGPVTNILKKPELIEGPNLYRRDGWYYLMLAEGGTDWNHGISMARSRSITGPYELDPAEAVLTARNDPANPLQKAGHGELVETPDGEWFLAHLAARPMPSSNRCLLARETCLQKVIWSEDGWLRLAGGGVRPALEIGDPLLPAQSLPPVPTRDDFSTPTLDPSWSSLRVPIDESWLSLTARPGWLRLTGRESLHSLFDQSLIAKRLQGFRVRAETQMEFEPDHFNQSAGLICYYQTRMHFYLRVTHDEARGKILGVVLTDQGNYGELRDSEVEISAWPQIHLRAEIDFENLIFSASPDGKAWRQIGPVLDASKLSTDYLYGFTGAMIGLCAQDLGGTGRVVEFVLLKMVCLANSTCPEE